MKKILAKFGYVLMVVMCLFLHACVEEEMFQKDGSSLVQVIGRITTYDECNVTSRGIKTSDESHISSMCLFIFDNAKQCINIQYLEGANPTFIIDRTLLDEVTTNDLTACQLYIVANVTENVIKNTWGYAFDNNNKPTTTFSVDDFLSKSCATSSSQMLTKGFPMIGNLEQNLDPDENLSGAVLEIPLDNLYAKVVFNIQVNTHQTPDVGVTPQFQLSQWEVHNLPTGVCLGGSSAEHSNQTPFYNTAHSTAYTSRAVTGNNPVSGSNVLSFTFYMPEHLVNSKTITYPTGIKDEEKQRYKPECVASGSKPTYVKIKGGFTDHQGHVQSMEYDVYLGSNNYDNFQVERNCQYNNNIIITGGTNHNADAVYGTISVDHRVTLGNSGYYIAIEQEATLDAHWNVVPMDLYIDGANTVTVTIENSDWIRMERIPQATMETAGYAAYTGIRDYFTTNLVTETLASNTSDTCSHRDRIYFYIDENISLSKRTADVSLSFSGDASKNRTLTFTQVGLKPVFVSRNGVSRTIYIEDKEEYLYHYDPLNTYNTEQVYSGLEWGHNNEATGVEYNSPYLDGLDYTRTIIGNNRSYKIVDIPQTAAEYCNNKGKKDPNDKTTYTTLSATNGVWYLPAITEMETIMAEFFNQYEEFQNNFYWSSAPAKKSSGFLGLGTAEEATRARATRVKVTFNNGEKVFNYYESGSKNNDDNYDASVDYDYFVPNGTYNDYVGHAGYDSNDEKFRGGRALRTEVFRIRAAYRPPTGKTVTENGLE